MRRQQLHARGARLAAPPVALALLLLGTTSCGGLGHVAESAAKGADDVARGADDVARGADDLDGGLQVPDVPPAAPAQAGAGSQEAAQLAGQVIAAHTGDLDPVTAEQVVRAACEADGLLGAGRAGSVPEAVRQVLADHGGNNTVRFRVESLTEDLQAAGSRGEEVWLTAKFVVREAV